MTEYNDIVQSWQGVPSNQYSEKDYESAIPKCCRLTTLRQHMDILLCWSLCASIQQNSPIVCGWCEFNNEHTEDEWRAWYRNEQSKMKVWSILND